MKNTKNKINSIISGIKEVAFQSETQKIEDVNDNVPSGFENSFKSDLYVGNYRNN